MATKVNSDEIIDEDTQKDNNSAKISALLMLLCIVISWLLSLGVIASDWSSIGKAGRIAWLSPYCAFLWLWSLKNVTVGPLKKDLGILTNLIGFISGSLDLLGGEKTLSGGLHSLAVFSLICLFLHWSFAVLIYVRIYRKHGIRGAGPEMGKKLSKPDWFFHVFALHVFSGWALWLVSLLWVM